MRLFLLSLTFLLLSLVLGMMPGCGSKQQPLEDASPVAKPKAGKIDSRKVGFK
jgi:hypothetical protein